MSCERRHKPFKRFTRPTRAPYSIHPTLGEYLLLLLPYILFGCRDIVYPGLYSPALDCPRVKGGVLLWVIVIVDARL